MKLKLNISFWAASLLLLGAAASCTPYSKQHQNDGATSGHFKMACDESFQNVLDQEIDVFEYQYPKATVLCRYMSETAALDSLMQGKVNLIVTSKDLSEKQRYDLQQANRAARSRVIAVDAVAIIVNKDCDIDELDLDDLAALFSGKCRKWGDLAPTKMRGDSIKLLFDGHAGGVIHYIRDKFLGGKDFPMTVYSAHSSEEVFNLIEKNRNAIGFVGVSWVADDMGASKQKIEDRVAKLNAEQTAPTAIDFQKRVKVLKIRPKDRLNGVKPYQAYINDGSYPLFRKIYAIDAAPLGSVAHSFFVFLTGSIGQKIILQTGIMPAAEPVRTVQLQ